jgi:hypothetical protein
LEKRFNQKGVVTANAIYFVENRIFNQHQIRKIVDADELNSIHFRQITTDFFSIGDPFSDSLVNYTKFISFIDCNVTEGFSIESARFINGFYINNLHQTGHWITFSRSVFDKGLLVWYGNYKSGLFKFFDCYFRDKVNMVGNNFDIPFRIYRSTFDSTLILTRSTFKESFLIQDSKISNLLLNGCSFQNKPKFNRVIILDTLDITNTQFESGIDFRRLDLSKVNIIFLENTFYPLGEFTVDWKQIKGKEKPRISLKEVSEDEEDNFKRIEEIYNLLYKNYLAQGDKTSADQVKYELALQKEIIVGGFWQWLYGITLGYGYEPIRFLIFPILVTILIFWFIWYKSYYNIVAYILNKDLDSDLGFTTNSHVGFPTKKIKGFTFIDHKKLTSQINLITRNWHSLHFSVSVLLGIRFKKEWMHLEIKHKTGTKSFLWITTLEYLLGKIYLVLLLILIKVHYFENWKSFLGI